MILITGATGQLGGAALEQAASIAGKENVVAFARNKEKGQALEAQGYTVRFGDFDNKAALEAAMEGIDKVFLVPTVDHHRFEQHKNVVDAAKSAGVSHLVYAGVTMKDLSTSKLIPLMESHYQTDDYIRQSGIPYTLLHNNLYMDVIPMFVGEQVIEKGIYLPTGDGKVAFALRREMGEAAANVITGSLHENKEYAITGAAAYSYQDIADTLGALSGKTVNFHDANPDSFEEILTSYGLPEFAIFMTNGFSLDTRNGQFSEVSGDLENLLGRKPADLKTGLKEIFGL